MDKVKKTVGNEQHWLKFSAFTLAGLALEGSVAATARAPSPAPARARKRRSVA